MHTVHVGTEACGSSAVCMHCLCHAGMLGAADAACLGTCSSTQCSTAASGQCSCSGQACCSSHPSTACCNLHGSSSRIGCTARRTRRKCMLGMHPFAHVGQNNAAAHHMQMQHVQEQPQPDCGEPSCSQPPHQQQQQQQHTSVQQQAPHHTHAPHKQHSAHVRPRPCRHHRPPSWPHSTASRHHIHPHHSRPLPLILLYLAAAALTLAPRAACAATPTTIDCPCWPAAGPYPCNGTTSPVTLTTNNLPGAYYRLCVPTPLYDARWGAVYAQWCWDAACWPKPFQAGTITARLDWDAAGQG